jgi:hypothetical protein
MAPMNSMTTPARPVFFGPTVVRAAFVLAVFGWGLGFYGPPIYLQAVLLRTGWPLALVSSAVTVHFLAGVLVVANLPRLHARFGLPLTTLAGACVTSLGLLGWALAAQPWQLFAAAIFSGMGWVTMGAVTVNALVSPWHSRSRPQALARAYNGASLGGVIFSPLWVALIAGWGFAAAAVAVGVLTVAIMALLGWKVFGRTPAQMGQHADGDALAPQPPAAATAAAALPGAALWRDRAFQTLALGMALGLFAQIGLLAHLFSWLVPALGAQNAGLVMGGATACAIGGRWVAARLALRIAERRHVAALAYLVQALGTLLLLLAGPEQTGWLLLGVALFGSGIGNATSLPPLIAQADFSGTDVTRAVALVVAGAQATYAFAPLLFGLLLAGAGPRGTAFFVSVVLIQLLVCAVFLAGRRRSRP